MGSIGLSRGFCRTPVSGSLGTIGSAWGFCRAFVRCVWPEGGFVFKVSSWKLDLVSRWLMGLIGV